MGYRRIVACFLVGVALASCTSSATGGDSSEATEARFSEVAAGEDWNDVAVRLTGCDDTENIAAFAEYLRESNPIVGEAGLNAGQIVAFDSGRADIDGCTVERDGAEAAGGDSAQAPTQEQDSEPPVASAEEVQERDSEPQERDSEPPATSADEAEDVQTTASASSTSATSAPGPAPTPNPNLTMAFEEDFSSESSLERFNWQVFHGVPSYGTPDTWLGDHDLSCGPPTTTRIIRNPFTEIVSGAPISTDVGDTAYWCDPAPGKEHLMTSFDSAGYAHLDFAPSQSFESVSRVCWDQNMNDLGRKWTQISVISEARFQANDERLDYILPTLDGPGDRGVQLADDDFLFKMREGIPSVFVGQDSEDANRSVFTTLDKARRYRICVEDLENGTIQVELERESDIKVVMLNGAMPEGAARVMFQDVTYNATKRKSPLSDPFTWHWDNLTIETR